MFSSTDPKIKAYAQATSMKEIKAGNERLKELEYVSRIQLEILKYRHNGVHWREVDTTQGDPIEVGVKSCRCEINDAGSVKCRILIAASGSATVSGVCTVQYMYGGTRPGFRRDARGLRVGNPFRDN